MLFQYYDRVVAYFSIPLQREGGVRGIRPSPPSHQRLIDTTILKFEFIRDYKK